MENHPGMLAAPSAVPINSGDMVGNYRIVSEIGGGSMGVVYRAFDVDMELERAIKVLRPGKPEYIRRKFEAEGKITARLDHPNIVRVYGGGVYQNLPFIQMELIDGKSMRLLLTALTRFHPAIAVSIVSIMAEALDFASQQSFSIWGNSFQNLVHRDLKPENVLFSRTAGLKIADFGLARLGDEKDFAGWGTAEYMSPEQHDLKAVDCRSDIFAIGIMLYEMLCGVRPFPDDPDAASKQKHNGRFEPVMESNPSAPQSIIDIVNRCLEPDITRRYQTYANLHKAADEAVQSLIKESAGSIIQKFSAEPTKYKPSLYEVRQKKRVRKSNFRMLAIIAATLTGFCIIGYFLLSQKPEPATAALPVSQMSIDTAKTVVAPAPDTIPVQPTKTAEPARAAKPTEPEPKKSILASAIDAHSRSDFPQVVSLLSPMDFSFLAKPTQDSAVVFLTDAYYMTRSVKDVIAMGKKYDLNDARFNWVVAMAYDVIQNYPKAMLYIDKAIVSPIHIGTVPRNNILFERAAIYQDNFNKMKDEASRKDMIDAYRQYIAEICQKSSSNNCNDARQILKSYE